LTWCANEGAAILRVTAKAAQSFMEARGIEDLRTELWGGITRRG
jgi:hypothetical protein